MKKSILICVLSLFALICLAQNEQARPTFGVDIQRPVAYAIINGKKHFDVSIELKAAEEYNIIAPGVKIVVTHQLTGKKIFKKRFSNSYLYAFSDGTIQVGKGNAIIQLILTKMENSDKWALELREKGIY